MGKMRRKTQAQIYFVFFFLSNLIIFQDCTPSSFETIVPGAPNITTRSSVGGGTNGGFDGMVFVATGKCRGRGRASDIQVEAAVKLSRDFNTLTLTRVNCGDIPEERQENLSASHFTFTTSMRNELRLRGRKFTLQNIQLSTLVESWSCALDAPTEATAKVYHDPGMPSVHYSQYSGPTESGATLVSDLVRAKQSIGGAAVYYDTAPYDGSLIQGPPQIGVAILASTSASVHLQSQVGGGIQMTCMPALQPLVSQSTTTPTPTPTPIREASSRWTYLGHAESYQLAVLQAGRCSTEPPLPSSCLNIGALCYGYFGSYFDGNSQKFNFFRCQ